MSHTYAGREQRKKKKDGGKGHLDTSWSSRQGCRQGSRQGSRQAAGRSNQGSRPAWSRQRAQHPSRSRSRGAARSKQIKRHTSPLSAFAFAFARCVAGSQCSAHYLGRVCGAVKIWWHFLPCCCLRLAKVTSILGQFMRGTWCVWNFHLVRRDGCGCCCCCCCGRTTLSQLHFIIFSRALAHTHTQRYYSTHTARQRTHSPYLQPFRGTITRYGFAALPLALLALDSSLWLATPCQCCLNGGVACCASVCVSACGSYMRRGLAALRTFPQDAFPWRFMPAPSVCCIRCLPALDVDAAVAAEQLFWLVLIEIMRQSW